MDNLFMGKNGFVWWFGRVESNADPLGVGRVRVRIAGWHTEDDNELPTEALPWAYPIMPITNSGVGGIGQTPIGPLPGTRVMGYFLDGELGQQPMILGTLSGETNIKFNRAIENGSTPYQPIIHKFLGFSQNTHEGDCPEGYQTQHNVVNETPIDDRILKINKSDWSIPFTGFVSSAFGEKRARNSHKGVDICPAGFFKQTDAGSKFVGNRLRGKTNLPVYAAADGEVVYIWTNDKGQHGVHTEYDKTGVGSRSFGNAVAIKHTLSDKTYTTIYAHLGINQDPGKDNPKDGIIVSVGDKVKKGQQIGTVGRTHVRDSLTHLHFEIRLGDALPAANNAIDPGLIFPQLKYRHTTFRSWVESQTNYNVEPEFDVASAPVKTGEGPKV